LLCTFTPSLRASLRAVLVSTVSLQTSKLCLRFVEGKGMLDATKIGRRYLMVRSMQEERLEVGERHCFSGDLVSNMFILEN
jgi:hypothetical protein